MIKKRILSVALVSALVALSFTPQVMAADTKKPTNSSSVVEADGSTGGVFVNTVDGKTIMDYPTTAEVKKAQEKKTAMANLHFQYKKGEVTKETYTAKLKALGVSADIISSATNAQVFDTGTSSLSTASMSASASSSKRIASIVQIPQINSYYCGPATASELIKGRTGTLVSQSTLAGPLRTDEFGNTPWYAQGTGTGYPMADTLNSYVGQFYVPYGTYVVADQFQNKVVADIDLNYGTAGDAMEVYGGPHLTGHPNTDIYHWFAIDGYLNYANDIWYMDSVYGSTISWAGNVPRYSNMDYVTLARIVNGRGIMW